MQVPLNEASDLIEIAIKANLTLFIWGSPAIGKSSVVYQLAEKYNLKVIDLRLSQCDPTEINGFPFVVNDIATYIPMDVFPLETTPLPEGKFAWLLFLDEMNSASKSVAAASYKLILDRMVGQHKLHDKVAIVCAGNLDTDGAITEEMSTALQSRLCHIEVFPTLEGFTKYTLDKGFDYRITSYLEFKPSSLYSFKPDHTDKTYSSPRTWEFANRILSKTDDYNKLLPLLSGVLSEGIAREFIAFMRHEDKMPKIQTVIANAKTLEIPEEPSVLYALSGSLAYHMNEDNSKSIMEYVARMPMEFQIITLRNVTQRHKTKWANEVKTTWANKNFEKLY